jgi:hypothetical protein
VRFSLEHHFTADALVVLGGMIDADFYRTLALPDLSLPEIEERADDGDVGLLGLRYRFTGHLDPIARRLLSGGELAWRQRVTIDRAARRAHLTFAADRQPDRLYGSGDFVLHDDEAGSSRTFDGDVVVAVPLVGRTAERAIVGGLATRLDLEAAALETRLTQSPRSP